MRFAVRQWHTYPPVTARGCNVTVLAMAASRMVCVADYERYAEENLPKTIREYFNSGANYEQTYADNVAAFKR